MHQDDKKPILLLDEKNSEAKKVGTKRERYESLDEEDKIQMLLEEEFVKTEIECRKELHLLQLEVEKKRIRNLDMEYEVLKAKLNFYQRKLNGKN